MIITMLMFLYNILLFVLPIEAVVGHFCSSTITWIFIIVFGVIYYYLPMIAKDNPYIIMLPDLIIHIMFLVGAYFAYTDFSIWFFIFYIVIMLSLYIRTIWKTISNRR